MIQVEEILVADECWIALAQLHRENPDRAGFSPREIMDRVKLEKAPTELRPGVQPHIYLHNVANIPPNSAKYRMFYRLEDGKLRLFRRGDDFHAARAGKTKPDRSDLPSRYHPLFDWYENDYCTVRSREDKDNDPVLQMRGVGKEIWADEGGDAFIARERAAWDDPPSTVQHVAQKSQLDNSWNRIAAHQGEEFRTITGLPFTYKIESSSGIWFYRAGRRINKRLSRSDLEKAISRCPLAKTTDISDCFDSAYLFGLLMDRRIRDVDW